MDKIKRSYRFFAVGALGFFIDAFFFTVFFGLIQNPYLARLASFLFAVCATFIFNSRFTFGDKKKARPFVYFLSQTLGAGINLLIFSLIIWHPFWLPFQYYIGLVSGSLAAMFFNFEMSRRYAFI